ASDRVTPNTLTPSPAPFWLKRSAYRSPLFRDVMHRWPFKFVGGSSPHVTLALPGCSFLQEVEHDGGRSGATGKGGRSRRAGAALQPRVAAGLCAGLRVDAQSMRRRGPNAGGLPACAQ